MTEENTKGVSRETYAIEYDYQAAMLRYSNDYNALLDSVPKDQEQIRETMEEMFYPKPDKLLNPEKLQELKTENPVLFGKVHLIYMNYLKKRLGLEQVIYTRII